MGEGCFIVGTSSTLWYMSSLWGLGGLVTVPEARSWRPEEGNLVPHPQFPKYLPDSGAAKAAIKRH